MFNNIYKGKRVLITGNTGFKGSWLSIWLKMLGAEVAGLANGVPTNPSNYKVSRLDKKIKQYTVDVRDYNSILNVFKSFKPDIVFHLAAQALVRKSISQPRLTFETNSLGTLNVLEALRNYKKDIVAVIITSDKSYRNLEWEWGYRETDELGGDDPYSASKGCAELICRSYANTFGLKIATARAGNVIGGGDWADDRIIPDCVRTWNANKTLLIRQPNSTRPWQYILEPLSGYLLLGEKLLKTPNKFKGEAYNFGPNINMSYSVGELVKTLAQHWEKARYSANKTRNNSKYECGFLKLNCDKAFFHLKWRAILDFQETIKMTADWYIRYYETKENMYDFTKKQIQKYIASAEKQKMLWLK